MSTAGTKSAKPGTIEVRTAWNSEKKDGKPKTVSLDTASEMLANLVNENALTRTKDRTYVVCLCKPNVLVRTTERTVTFAPGSHDDSKGDISQLRAAAITRLRRLNNLRLVRRCVTLKKDIFNLGTAPRDWL